MRVIFTPQERINGHSYGPCFVVHGPVEEAAIERGEEPSQKATWVSEAEAEAMAAEYDCELEVV